MQNKEQLKQTLINKIKQTRQGRKIPKLNEYPLEAIQFFIILKLLINYSLVSVKFL